MLRDEPMDAAIPEKFEPSDYHPKAIAESKSELLQLEAMTPKEAEAGAEASFQRETEDNNRYIAESRDLKAKYTEMLTRVNEWQPPSADHEGMKAFMVEQIESSIKHDCSDYHERPESQPVRLSGSAWLAKECDRARRSISYHEVEYVKEVERSTGRTKWVADLRASLQSTEAVPC